MLLVFSKTRRSRAWVLASLLALAVTPASLAQNQCVDDAISEFLRVDSGTPREDLERYAEVALGRRVTPDELDALQAAVKGDSPESQAQALTGKLDDKEVERLRRFGILGKTAEAAEDKTLFLQASSVPLEELGGNVLGEVRRGRSYNYFIDLDGHIHLCERSLEMPGDQEVRIYRDVFSGDTYVAKETGKLRLNPKTKHPELIREFVADGASGEPEEIVAQLKKDNPDLEISRAELPGRKAEQAITCLEIMARQGSAKSFIQDRIITSNVVSAATIVISNGIDKARGKTPRLATAHGREVTAADFITNNLGTVVSSFVGAGLFRAEPALMENIGKTGALMLTLGARTATTYGMTDVNKPIYNTLVEPEPNSTEKTSEKIAHFDKLHTIARLPINYGVDAFVHKILPMMLFDACRKGAPLQVLYSQKMIRIYERGVSTLIYLGARRALINE